MKTKLFVGLAVLLLAVNCSPKLDAENVGKVVRATFNLTEKDRIEVTGIAKETSGVMLVKFRINGTEVNSKMRKYDKGWQLDEVQNRLGGWIPATTIKDRFDPVAKMETVKADIELIAYALLTFLVVHEKFSFGGTPAFNEDSDVYKALCPLYVKSLPTFDPWGRPYSIIFGKGIGGSLLYGIPMDSYDDFFIFSFGRDGKMENWVYDPKNERSGLYSLPDPDKDMVYLNGVFIRAPESWR